MNELSKTTNSHRFFPDTIGDRSRPGTDTIRLREAEQRDLEQINDLVAAAIGTWPMPERVKRLSLSLYRYHELDLGHMLIMLAEYGDTGLAGIASIEAADASDCPLGLNAALLHGLYVDPLIHRNGVGTRLLQHMQTIASTRGFDGLLVKAYSETASFFEASAFEKLPTENPSRDYPYRYWKSF